MFWNKYPYTDFHELNLDMILQLMKELHSEWNEFTAVNKITNAGAWDITKQYQAWTVVSDNNIGYISFKPVPAGVAITNIEYWGVIADYNILITDLSNRISILESKMATAETNIADIRSHKRNIICIGDSYSDAAIMGFDCWPELLSLYMPNSTIYTYANNGGGFTIPGVSTLMTFEDCLNAFTGDKSEITDIICIGGSNDRNSAEIDVLNAINSFCQNIKDNYKNAKYYIGFCGWTDVLYAITDSENFLKCQTWYENASVHGATIITGLNNIMHDYKNFGTTAHPNRSAEVKIAQNIANFINGGNVDYHSSGDVSYTLANDITTPHSNYAIKMTASIDNDVTKLSMFSPAPPTCIFGCNNVNLTAGQYLHLLTLDSDSIYRGLGIIINNDPYPNLTGCFRMPVQIRYTSGGVLSSYIPAILECYNTIMRIVQYETNATITDLRILLPNSITIPTRFN